MIKFIFGDKHTAKNPLILKYVRVDSVNRSNKNILHSVNKPVDKSYGQVIQRWSTNSPKVRVSGTIVNKLFDDSKSALTIGAEAINQIPGAVDGIKNTFGWKTSKVVENVIEDDMYPQEEMEELQRLLEYEGSIKVIHSVLNAQGINRVVVNNASLPFTEGEIYQDFTINFIVDSQVADDLLIEARAVSPQKSRPLGPFDLGDTQPILNVELESIEFEKDLKWVLDNMPNEE